MSHVEKRGYQLILKNQDALWVLEKDKHESEDCSGNFAKHSPPQSRDTIDTAVDEDPLEAILREKAIQVREQIRLRLAWYCAPPTSRSHDERLEIICAYVRRAIYQDASLMFLSQNYDGVMALLNDQNLDLATMEKIRNTIHALCIHDIHSAVDDVIRSTNGDHVVVLGGRVFKDHSGERWPLHAWGHAIAFRDCYSCLRTICRTIDQVIDLTRYVLFTQMSLRQTEGSKYEFSTDGSRELVLAGFITDDIPLSSHRGAVVCIESSGRSKTWEENQHTLSLYAGLSLSEEAAQAFANACYRHPDLMVLLRKGANARIIRSTPLVWTSRRRIAQSRSALDSVPWDKEHYTKLPDFALEEAQPPGWGREPIAECIQFIVLDTTECTMGDFVQKLVRIWCKVHNVNDKNGLYNKIKGLYDATGELEPYEKVTHEIAWEHYRRLWGCEPDPTVMLEDLNEC
ncbi:hypothetical protein JVU11DRAFT_12032 [Chiua virens]|nr:hypothetical protein JVU11DRAFT_12032 [Chiua virens]